MKAKDLKFRRWIEQRNEYFYFTAEDIYISDHYDLTREGLFEDWDNMVLEQYTGLKDKNDKEIYEGDYVIYVDTIKYRGQVIFRFGAFGICEYFWDPDDECFMSFEQRNDEWSDDYENLEIVGNIHETGDIN